MYCTDTFLRIAVLQAALTFLIKVHRNKQDLHRTLHKSFPNQKIKFVHLSQKSNIHLVLSYHVKVSQPINNVLFHK